MVAIESERERELSYERARGSPAMEVGDKMKSSASLSYLSGGAAALGLLLLSSASVQAVPTGAVATALGDQVHASANIVEAVSRRCYWRRGVRYCREAADRPRIQERRSGYGYGYGYDYGTPRPEFYPFGSSAWWHAMEREGRVFRGPN
jgi:hypothetical protein